MVRRVDAIFSQGAFRPLEPLTLPEGTRVQLSVEEKQGAQPPTTPKLRTPRLANAKDAADFVMKVRESRDAGV